MGSNLFFFYPPLSQPLQLLQCIVDEVSLCPIYTKPSLMGWKADILFPNEARCIISSAQGLSSEELDLSRARPC